MPAVRDELVGPRPALDSVLGSIRANRGSFARLTAAHKAALVGECLPTLAASAPEWVAEACRAKGISVNAPTAGEEWSGGPYAVARFLNLLAGSLDEIARRGKPGLGTSVGVAANGQLTVGVFPINLFDRVSMPGLFARAVLLPGVDAAQARSRQAAAYAESAPKGSVCLVLGAGNVASIPPLDALTALFVENSVCLVKLNPVNAYLAPVFEQALEPLVRAGYLGFVRGDGAVGAYLCDHPDVDWIHITGSDETFERIVWGPPGDERERLKAAGTPRLTKRITAELGSVTPMLIVPGSYTSRQLWFQARNLATMIANNASFNCIAAKVLVLSRGWPQRQAFLDLLRRALNQTPTRKAYYPGAFDRYARLTAPGDGRQVERIGAPGHADLPWTLVTGLATESDDPLFRTEPFCSILSVVELEPAHPAAFLAAATSFANTRLWGTLSAMLVAPRGLPTPLLDRAIDDLHYGTVAVNHWSGLGFAWGSTAWGAYPGATLADPQSGIGWVHNSFMLEDIEKVIIRGPLTTPYKPAWFVDHAAADRVGRELFNWHTRPSPRGLLELGRAALSG